MWNFVDDDGRADYSPLSLKLKILPADNADISALLGEIRGSSLIHIYTVEGKHFFQVCGFAKHQKIDKRSPSRIPAPPNSPEFPRTPTTDRRRIKEWRKEVAASDDASADARLSTPNGRASLAKTSGWLIDK